MNFEQMEKEFGPMIRRIAASHEANPSLAEELVQDIWLALWRALPSFREQSSLRTFVARIAAFRAISHARRGARLPRHAAMSEEIPAPEAGPEQEAIARDRQARLMGAVRALPLLLRQVAVLTLEGLAPQDIAAVLGISANAVAIRLSRAREALRNQLGEGS